MSAAGKSRRKSITLIVNITKNMGKFILILMYFKTQYYNEQHYNHKKPDI